MDLSLIMNSSPSHTPQRSTSGIPPQSNISRAEFHESLKRSDGKFRCGNPACTTKQNTVRTGHQSCVGFFCKPCCVETVRLARERNEPVTRCTVPGHASGAGTLTGTVPPHVIGTGLAKGRQQPILGQLVRQQNTELAASQTSRPVAIGLDTEPLVAPSNHAAPIADMWQNVGKLWLGEFQEAAVMDVNAGKYKQAAAETKVLQRTGITVLVWFENGREPIRYRLYPNSFPHFLHKNHSDLYSVLFSEFSTIVETWVPSDKTWEIQGPNTVRTVATDMVLLYRLLPNGPKGDQLQDCPRLDEYLAQQGNSGVPVPMKSMVGHKRGRDDDEAEERVKKRGGMEEVQIGSSRRGSDRSSRSMSRSRRTVSQTTPARQRSTSTRRRSRSTSTALDQPLQTFPLSPPTTEGSHTITRQTAPALLPIRPNFPLANNHTLGPDNERAFPSSFYATDIFTIFEHIKDLQAQRRPRIHRKEAFHLATGLNYFVLGTFKKHHAVYTHNQHLVSRFKHLGRTSVSTWKRFSYEAQHHRSSAGADALDTISLDSDSDSDDEDSKPRIRASSIISIADDSDDEETAATIGDGAAGQLEIVLEDFDTLEDDNMAEGDDTLTGGQWSDPYLAMDIDDERSRDWTESCPYCDEPLPLEPSDDLKALRKSLDAKSIPDRNNRDASLNPHHRYIRPFTDTGEHCERHRFELDFASVLHKAAWAAALPICFDKLEHRVISLIDVLNGVIDFPWDNEYYQELKDAIATHGESATFSIRGQYVSFGRTSVGYGGRGMEIIFKVLCHHFSPRTSVWGIPMMQFIHHVLIPETAVRLIEEDLHLVNLNAHDRRNAITIKDESTRYGNIQNKA
ncbi:hypothetical protein HWV62_5049 [Athelia sp. TMB]|nr:hypothetical protein HWV62_5049 [Athelia sp. TMB]